MARASAQVMIGGRHRCTPSCARDSRVSVQSNRRKERGSTCRKYLPRVQLPETSPNSASIFSPTPRPHCASSTPFGDHLAEHRARNRSRTRRPDFPAGPARPAPDCHRTRSRPGRATAHEVSLTPNVEIIEGDILAIDFDTLFGPKPGQHAPRNRTTARTGARCRQSPLLHHVRHPAAPVRATADTSTPSCSWCSVKSPTAWPRIPGRSEYGLLSATAQLYASVEKLFTLPPSAFSPPPEGPLRGRPADHCLPHRRA